MQLLGIPLRRPCLGVESLTRWLCLSSHAQRLPATVSRGSGRHHPPTRKSARRQAGGRATKKLAAAPRRRSRMGRARTRLLHPGALPQPPGCRGAGCGTRGVSRRVRRCAKQAFNSCPGPGAAPVPRAACAAGRQPPGMVAAAVAAARAPCAAVITGLQEAAQRNARQAAALRRRSKDPPAGGAGAGLPRAVFEGRPACKYVKRSCTPLGALRWRCSAPGGQPWSPAAAAQLV